MADEILKELWEIKDAIAREHGNDLESLVAYLRSKERLDRHRLVDLHLARASAEQGAPADADKPRR